MARKRGNTPWASARSARIHAPPRNTSSVYTTTAGNPSRHACSARMVFGFSALLFCSFCLGAYLYHLLKGRVAFANSTLPWA